MSEPDKPKRKLWQIHLSTMVALVLIAGMLLWLNLQSRFSVSREFTSADNYAIGCIESGWPLTCSQTKAVLYKEESEASKQAATTASVIVCIKDGAYAVPVLLGNTRLVLSDILTSLGSFVLDLLVGIAIICGTAMFSEWLIRRRETRKT